MDVEGSPSVPHLRSIKAWFVHIFYGLCVGAADIVPGFSGGTMALILGIYENLINSIKSCSSLSAFAIFKGDFKTFSRGVSWDYLVAVVIGILFSIAILSQAVHWILGHEVYRVYMYSLFLGMICASFIVLLKMSQGWKAWHTVPFIAGCIIAFVLTSSIEEPVYSAGLPTSLINPWLIMSGAVAITAMLLPGISGMYLLMILGTYPQFVAAMAGLIRGFRAYTFDVDAFLVLANLGFGILCGAIAFSKAISWLLRKHHAATLAMLLGFMLGAIQKVWPFWTYEYHGSQLYPVAPYIPSFDNILLWYAIGVAFLGLFVVLIIEGIAAKKQGKGGKSYVEHKMESGRSGIVPVDQPKLESR